ncbi:hypothetical protein LNQ03_22675 [Klebsiella pneumoniae subsp. pneumoniae]|nr:hypothetical protein [Klebsiella pneumoniae subsp. pneumoniae]
MLVHRNNGKLKKSRCRKQSEQGFDIGIALDRRMRLTDGDILLCDDDKNTC